MFKRENDRKRTPVRSGRGRDVRVKNGKPGIRFGGVLVLLALFAAVAWFAGRPAVASVTALPVFTVARVVVEGAEHLDRNRMIEVSGITPGENIFRIDFHKAAEALGKEFAVREFIVFRRLPDTVVIRVSERKPVALLNAGGIIGIDAEGVPLPHIGESMSESLPVITGIDDVRSLADPGVKARVIAGLKLLDTVAKQSPEVSGRISEVNVNSLSSLGVSLIGSGAEIVLGDTGWSEKLVTLNRVMEQVAGHMDSVLKIDLRFDGKVFLKKVEPSGKKPGAAVAAADSGIAPDGGMIGSGHGAVGRRADASDGKAVTAKESLR